MSKPLTYEEYISDPNQCPFCQSRSIQGHSGLDGEAGVVWQKIGCEDCGEIWHDNYQLIGYERCKED